MIYLKLFAVLLVLGLIFSLGFGSLVSQFKAKTPSTPPMSFHQQAPKQTAFIKVAANGAEQNNAAEPETAQDIKLTPEEEAEAQTQDEQMPQGGGNNVNTQKPKDPVEQAFEKAFKKYGAVIFLAIFGVILLYAFALVFIIAYTKSRITNLVMNNTSLDNIRFISTQRMRDLVGLYLSNGLLIMFTGGLAMPWTQIRSARYYLEHLAIEGEADLDKFVGEKKETVRALGEELADMFDVDISFG